ncbi:MAG: ATP-dependent DNA helicase [Patescibacteria group bacterium]
MTSPKATASQDKSADQYRNLLAMLNPEQLQAVETIEGPVMVLAGPGTGKTQVLAARIAAILQKTDTPPQSILAITFTDAAAKNMRERLVSLIGQTGYYVSIMTFHAFCADVLSEQSDQFPINPASQALSDLERYLLIEKLLSELELEVLKPLNDPRHYARSILEAISNVKKEGYNPTTFAKLVKDDFAEPPDTKNKTTLAAFEKKRQKNTELAQVFSAYQQALGEMARYDFDDMINLVLEGFKTQSTLLQTYQERYQYVLTDEYQDTNATQNELLWQLSAHWGEAANIFVVGDPHQAIFRFQGASVENVYAFLERFPTATVINLTQGYRCPQPIYDSAHKLIGENQLTAQSGTSIETAISQQLQQSLQSQQEHDRTTKQIITYSTPSDIQEWLILVQEIKQLLNRGVAADQIAILTKTNAESLQLADVLAQHNIVTKTQAEQNALNVKAVQDVLRLIQVVDELEAQADSYTLYQVLLQPWWELESAVVYQLVQKAGRERGSLYHLLQKDTEELVAVLPDVSATELEKIQQVVAQLESLGQLAAQTGISHWLREVFDQAGIIQWLRSDLSRLPDLMALLSFQKTVQEWADGAPSFSLSQLLESTAILQLHGLSIPVSSSAFAEEAVELSTVHGAKGKEWQYVFITACYDGKWGNARQRELLPLPDSVLKYTDVTKKERNEDDRRLFYVALTRASKAVYCTYPETLLAKGKTKAQVASMFLHEAGIFADLEQISLDDTAVQPTLAQLLAPPVLIDRTPAVRRFLQSEMADFKMSVSALNRYLRDPAEFVLNDVLRVPQVAQGHMIYGTALHAGIEKLVKQHLLGRTIDFAEIIATLDEGLRKGEFGEHEHARRLQQGTTVVEAYHQEKPFQPEMLAFTERTFGSTSKPVWMDDIALTGRIDRIDWVSPDEKTVRVIDYKASKPQSKNAIIGATAIDKLSHRERALPESIRGPYKRQLLFYKLLTDLDNTFQPTVIAGQFEFLYAESKKIITQHHFDLVDEEVGELKKVIREVVQEMRNLDFLDEK